MAPHDLSEALYAHAAEWRTHPDYTDAERIAIEYVEKFALDHTGLDDAFFARMRRFYSDEQILEIAACVGTWLMMGLNTRVMGVSGACPIRPPLEVP